MKISTKGRYALRMLVDIAEQSTDNPIPLKDISLRQNISKKYLEQIVPIMNHVGLLKTIRGFKGGYLLGRPANEITVYDVIATTEGSVAPVACLENTAATCSRADQCQTLWIWQGLNQQIVSYLKSITVADIAEHCPTKSDTANPGTVKTNENC